MRIGLVIACLAAVSFAAGASEQAIVIVPVTDVWSTPQASTWTFSDNLRQTQVLFGEHVIAQSSSGPWTQISIPDQPAFRPHQRWEGYPGWILTNALAPLHAPLGTRTAIIDIARGLIGVPYLWGGLTTEGADCSGLIHLAYRVNHIQIPRDSYDQWKKARPIKRSTLKPGDLIFSAKTENPKVISHVALYAGNGHILEAPQTGIAVRDISFKDKYGKDLSEVESGDTVGDHIIFFGRYLNS